MKFVCDQCKTKYSIDDARVRGKVLKIRCKQCNHIITVREETAARPTGPQPVQPAPALAKALDDSFAGGQPKSDFDDNAERTMISAGVDMAAVAAAVASSSAAKPARAAAGGDDWFVAFDGVQEGPLALEKLVQRVRAERGKEAHAWRDGFDGWIPVTDVPEIAQLLKAREPAAPRVQPSIVKPSTQPAPAPVAKPSPAPAASKPAAPAKPAVPSVPAAASHAPHAPSPASPSVTPIERRDPTGRPAPSPVRPVPSAIPAIPAAASAAPKPARAPAVEVAPRDTGLAAARKEPQQPTLMDQRAPTMAGRSSPAAAIAAAPALPAIETTPAPLPAPPVAEPAHPAPAALPAVAPIAARSEPAATPTPAPLPAPPPGKGIDLVIGEPSVVMPLPTAPPSPANGHSAAPSPVVIITGPAPAHHGWLKWAALGGAVVIVLLLGTVGYLLFGRKPPTVVVAAAPAAVEKPRPVDDKPATATIDPPVAPAPAPPTPAVAAKADPKTPSVKHTSTAPAPSKAPKLSNNQSNLAALYGDTDKSQVHDVPSVPKPEEHHAQVSETQIAEVVRKNKQSITLCYERVLKRDNQLKSARIDVDVRIGLSGGVTKVNVNGEYANAEIGTCISQAIKRWHFPAQDSEYGTSFPLLLQAQ